MTPRLTDHARQLLEVPLETVDPVKTLGRSLWLYLFFVTSANVLGFVVKSRARLAKALGVQEGTIEIWLARLVDAGLVRVVAPSPYLVISLRFWAGGSPSADANRSDSSGFTPSALDKGPVYGNSHSSAEAIALEKNGDRGAGKGDDLREELRAILPEADSAEIERILNHYPAATIAKTLDRVRKTPPAKIRKSKVALFRYLLAKFSQEIDVDDL